MWAVLLWGLGLRWFGGGVCVGVVWGRCGLCGGSVEMLKGDVGVVWEWC